MRVALLEEEIEVERAGASLEREVEGGLRAEMVALQVTILDLEGKLILKTLEAKNLSPPGQGQGGHSNGGAAKNLFANLTDVGDEDEKGGGGGAPGGLERPRLTGASEHRPASDDAHAPDGFAPHGRAPPAPPTDSAKAGREDGGDEEGDLQDLEADIKRTLQQGDLQDEIRSLEQSLASRDSEARSAQASAVNYADKYVRLRDDYESHVQVRFCERQYMNPP